MIRKPKEEFEKFGLIINMSKTKYMIVGDDHPKDVDIGTCIIKHCSSFTYLGVTLSSNGKSGEDMYIKPNRTG